MTKIKNGHEELTDIVCGLLKALNIPFERNVEYSNGELDIRITEGKVYLEVKTSYTKKQRTKAENQIKRAIEYGQASKGFVVCYSGVYNPYTREKIK